MTTVTIDLITHDEATHEWALIVVDTSPWRGDDAHLARLQSRLEDYVTFIETGELYRLYPQAKGMQTRIQIDCCRGVDAISIRTLRLLERAVEEHGFRFVLRETHEDAEQAIDRLVPTIRSADWVGDREDVAAEVLIADLHVVYAFDVGTSFVYPTWKTVESLALDRDAARRHAISNLRHRLPEELETRTDRTSSLIVVGGLYEASLVMLDDVWDWLERPEQGELLVCVLAQDVCVFTYTGLEGALESFRTVVQRMLGKGIEGFISKTLLQRRGRQWIEAEDRFTKATYGE